MKGSPEVIKQLNETLRGELLATNQYFLHASLVQEVGLPASLQKDLR